MWYWVVWKKINGAPTHLLYGYISANDYTDEIIYPNDAFFIQDSNAVIHALKHIPPTFGDICLNIMDQMVSKEKKYFLLTPTTRTLSKHKKG